MGGQRKLETIKFKSLLKRQITKSEVNSGRYLVTEWLCFYCFTNFLASPQTSFGVRLSRIHFSPTSVGGEMNA